MFRVLLVVLPVVDWLVIYRVATAAVRARSAPDPPERSRPASCWSGNEGRLRESEADDDRRAAGSTMTPP